MRFSIIVPIYNKQAYLADCLESIKAQSFDDFECLLIDDGSTDESAKICKYFCEIDDRFQYHYKKNGGLVSARKTGASVAKGEYIINIDADDLVENLFFETISKEIDNNGVDSVCFRYKILSDGSIKENKDIQSIGCYEGSSLEEIKKNYLFNTKQRTINSGSILFNICTKCIKREIYNTCQGHVNDSIKSGEDTVFTLAWCFYSQKVSFIKYDGYIYRMEPTSIEHTFDNRYFINLLNACNEMQKINIEKKGNYEESIKSYGFYRLMRYVNLLAIESANYFAFKKTIIIMTKEAHELFDYKIDYHGFNVLNTIKCKLLIKKRWLIMFILARMWFKRKL